MDTAAIESAQTDFKPSWSGHVLCTTDPLGWCISTSQCLPAPCESPRRDAHIPPHRCRPVLKISCRHGTKRDPIRLHSGGQPSRARESRWPAACATSRAAATGPAYPVVATVRFCQSDFRASNDSRLFQSAVREALPRAHQPSSAGHHDQASSDFPAARRPFTFKVLSWAFVASAEAALNTCITVH